MISKKYKCIFLNIPKNAGTSIVNAFDLSWNDEDGLFLNYGKYADTKQWEEYRDFYYDYYVFAVVRNPWDRFISAWKYLCMASPEKYKKMNLIEVLKKTSLEEFHVNDWFH